MKLDDPARPDLLTYLERYRRAPLRQFRRVERWRRRGLGNHQIAELADRVAARLEAAGARPGDRIGLYLNDGPLWVAGFFGALRLGGVAVPLDPTVQPSILEEAAAELQLSAWCTEPEVAGLELPMPKVELDWPQTARRPSGTGTTPAWPAPEPERTAQIVLTSGTSALPKTVAVSHRNLRAVLDPLAREIDKYRRYLRLVPPLRIAVALPLSHLYGQVMGVFLPSLLQAHTIMIPALQGPELAQLLRREGAWILASVPRTLSLLARYLQSAGEERWGRDGFAARLAEADASPWYRRPILFRSLRRLLGHRLIAVISGGAALDLELEQFFRRLGYVVVQGYGLTEAAPMVTLNHPFQTVAGSLGKPLPGVEVHIAADGEILVRGANVAAARIGGSAVDAEGWLHTGDLGRRDAEGRLFYLGRKGERIVTSAGVNVDPEPISAALRRQPGVIDALVLERPWGARGIVAAVILAQPGADVGQAARVVNRELPDAARIRVWHSWPGADLPRTHTGKARRSTIRTWLAEQAPARDRSPLDAIGPPGTAGTSGRETNRDLADPYAALLGMIEEITGEPADSLSRDALLLDALTSLDRVELATLLETAYGIGLQEEAFIGERTLEQLAKEIAAALAAGRSTAGADDATPDSVQPRHRERDAAPETGATPRPVGAATPVAGAQATDRIEDAPRAATRPAGTIVPGSRGAKAIPPAAWRFNPVARVGRLLIREAIMRPLLAAFVTLRVRGLEHLDEIEPPFLIASNHQSIMDPPALIFALPWRRRGRIAPAARWEHFTERDSGWLQYRTAVLGINLIPLVQVGDWRPTLRIVGDLVDRGYCPLIFPEGRRTTDGSLHRFQLGVAVIAQNLHLPIIPCGIAGLLSVLPRGGHWPHTPWPRRAPVGVTIGAPLAPPRPDEELRTIVATLRGRIDKLHDEAASLVGRP